jgi:Zn-finger protein
MLQRREIRKSLVLFLCVTILLYISPWASSTTIALGNETEPKEIVFESQQTENGQINILQKIEEQQVLTIYPFDGSFFNELILVNGEVTDPLLKEGKLTLTIFKDDQLFKEVKEDIELVVKDEKLIWEYEFLLSEKNVAGEFLYPEATYTMQMKVTGSDHLVSNVVPFIIDRTAPSIEISLPSETGQFVSRAIIEGTSDIDSTVHVTDVKGKKITSQKVDDTGNFSFQLDDLLEEGSHTLLLHAVDLAGNMGETKQTSFTYDKTRPYVSTANLTPKPSATGVDVNDVKISIKIVDANIDYRSIIAQNPIKLLEKGKGNHIPGSVSFDENTKVLTFTTHEKLKASTKYFVMIEPTLTDLAGNLIHSRSWSFTTKSSSALESPHGAYLNNTNSCKICHGVHNAPQAKIQQASLEYVNDPNEELKGKVTPDSINGYCMTCHDGTVASNMNSHLQQKSDHNKQVIRKADGKAVTQSCGNCHNVHLESHQSNPNLLKDHFVFDHTGINGASSVGRIDSSERLCESCHEYDLLDVLDEDQYSVYTYRNTNTSLADLHGSNSYGSSKDYELCLRCHNEDYAADYKGVNKAIADIKQFYERSKETSGHYILMDKVKDGSLLDGHMPCADCHETHSSANGMLIKNTLGHNAANRSTLESWPNASVTTSVNQRTLCLSCHNDETELYGITVSLPMKRADGTNINAHQPTSTNACSNCHGGTSKTFIEAVHAPSKRGK